MARITSEVVPFYIPPSGAAGAVTFVRGPAADLGARLKLDVVSGGPVFLFYGRRELADAKSHVHPSVPENVDFDLGASANGDAKGIVTQAPELLTVYSDAETVGYLQYEYDRDIRA